MSKKQNRNQIDDRALDELSEGVEPTADQKREMERKSQPLKFGLGDLLKAHLEKANG